MARKRETPRFKQIVAVPLEDDDPALYGLAEDGTVWIYNDELTQWIPLGDDG